MDVEVVRVWIGNPNNGGRFNGTAFFINSNTLITARHVVENYIDNRIYINTLSDGSTLPIEKENIQLCPRDIAILKTKIELNIPKINFTKKIEQEYKVNIKGFDGNEKSSINKLSNIISGYEGGEHHTYRLQNYIASGYSGSPVFIDNKLSGIVQARGKDKNLTYIIPISECCSEFIKNELEKSTSIDTFIPNTPLKFPNGRESLSSKYYIEREEDKECYDEFDIGERLIRIKAPRQFGKTSLIDRLADRAEKNHHIVELNFKCLELFLLKDTKKLLNYVCDYIADELEMDEEDKLNKNTLDRLTPNSGATKYMEKILKVSSKDILLIIDDADELFEYRNTSNDFFALIRAWNQKGQGRKKIWKKLKIILSHSTDATLATKYAKNSPFNNVGFGVELKSFSSYEVDVLLQKHNIELDSLNLDKLVSFIGGHPYLSRLTLYHISKKNKPLQFILDSNVYKDHMQQYMNKLNENDEYKQILKNILNEEKCRKIDNGKCFILESFGLIKNIFTDKVEFRCELYKEFFNRYL